MAFGRGKRRPSLREQKQKVNAALEFLGVPLRNEIKPKRERALNGAGASPAGTLEKDVLRAVGELLAVHPRVLLAVRQNSGAMQVENNGRLTPIWFYKLVKSEKKMTITDYWGFLRDGRPFAIECKRESWRRIDSDTRASEQDAFIRFIESIGGRGGFVRNVNDVEEILQ